MSTFLRRRKYQEKEDNRTFLRNGAILLENLITSCHGSYNPIRSFSAEDLKIATNNYGERFMTNDYGYKLYNGYLSNRPISVMKFEGSKGHLYWLNNIVFASQISHKNVLKLIGCCLETEIPILVFESVQFGSLDHHIHGSQSHQPCFETLVWKNRLKIAMEIANAVTYLHIEFPRPIIYKDLKLSHILFDERNVAKLMDFSLSESIPEGETHIKDGSFLEGRITFVAPERCAILDYNEKVDVYSFGDLLLELFTGQTIQDLAELARQDGCVLSDFLKKHIDNNTFNEIIDPKIVGEGSYPQKQQQLQASMELIYKCLSVSPEDRPTMIDVAKQLRQMYLSAA